MFLKTHEMNARLVFEWPVLALSVAIYSAGLIFPAWSGTVAAVSALFILINLYRSSFHPARMLFLSVFILISFVWLLLAHLSDPEEFLRILPIILVAFQLKLSIFAVTEREKRRNVHFAKELYPALPASSLLFVDNDIETSVPTGSLHAGHVVRALPNEKLPADGIITFGSGFVEELLITGQPQAIARGLGKFVFAGATNKSSSFLYRVAAAGSSTFLLKKAKFLEMGFGGPWHFSRPFFLLEGLAAMMALAMHFSFGLSWEETAEVLALGSAGALYVAAARFLEHSFVARSAAAGLLWRDAGAAEEIGKTDTVAFHPLGVLTEGNLKLNSVATVGSLTEDGVLRLAGPFARKLEGEAGYAILKELRLRNIHLEQIDNFILCQGGASGTISEEEYRWIDYPSAVSAEMNLSSFATFISLEPGEGNASIYFLIQNSTPIAALSFVDALRSNSAAVLANMRRRRVPVILVSGESKASLAAFGKALGVEHTFGECDNANELLNKISQSGLRPLWLDTGMFPAPKGKFSVLAAASTIDAQAELSSASWDIGSVWESIRLAKRYRNQTRQILYLTAVAQPFLLFLCIYRSEWTLVPATGLFALFSLWPGWNISRYRPN